MKLDSVVRIQEIEVENFKNVLKNKIKILNNIEVLYEAIRKI